MSDKNPRGETDPIERLERNKESFAATQTHLINLLSAFSDETREDPSNSAITAAIQTYLKALTNLQTLEAELEKRGQILRAEGAGHLDCDAARTEILERLARIRDRARSA